jgi:magnesium chelatase subunit I
MPHQPAIHTLGQLVQSGYQSITIKEELRNNLVRHMQQGSNPFTGIVGYDETVLPDLQRAILSGHNINLLGLRGQAKTRIARSLQSTAITRPFVGCTAMSATSKNSLHPMLPSPT